MNYLRKMTQGELSNPLSFPFLLSTLAYGIGFAFFLPFNNWLGHSSAFDAMSKVSNGLPVLWGLIAILTIVLALFSLKYTSLGQPAGMMGFALWAFVAMCYILSGDWLVLFGVALPNMIFWTWQYLSSWVDTRR